ncbi:tautomerase family protein [Thiocapsa sp. UBA6158]
MVSPDRLSTPQTTMVVIDEVETDNWGIGGESVTLRRRRDSV